MVDRKVFVASRSEIHLGTLCTCNHLGVVDWKVSVAFRSENHKAKRYFPRTPSPDAAGERTRQAERDRVGGWERETEEEGGRERENRRERDRERQSRRQSKREGARVGGRWSERET